MWIRLIKASTILSMPLLVNAQVASIRLTVQVPELPAGKNVFVAGSFNGWKAADSLYMMKKQDNSTYTIVLPVYKNVKYQYKYTAGGWSGVELGLNDSNIKNRSFITTGNKKKMKDTVMKWASPKPASKQNTSLQMMRINSMKDSVLNGLQPKLNEMLQLLKEYTTNLLQKNPSVEIDNRITADVTKHFADAYGRINELLHKIFEMITPEQKQMILKAISTPGADKDFINTLGAAINEAVK